jgi:hypothetical protein
MDRKHWEFAWGITGHSDLLGITRAMGFYHGKENLHSFASLMMNNRQFNE